MKFHSLIPRLTLGLCIIGIVTWATYNRSLFEPAILDEWLKAFGVFGPAIYVLIFALGTVSFVPGSLFALAGGVLFGPVLGSALNLVGATLGANLAFLIARYLASGWSARMAGGRLTQIVSGIEAEGWRFVALIRLVPLFPFNIINYALGLTRIGLLPYAITSFICMAPGAIAFTWLGYAGREAMNGNEASLKYGLFAMGALAAIAIVPRLFGRLKPFKTGWINADDLNRLIESGKSLTIIDVRGRDEFDGPLRHIPGALNIPLTEIKSWVAGFKTYTKHPIVLVCKTDKRSSDAANLLKKAGVQQLHVLRGGMEQWKRSGFETTFT